MRRAAVYICNVFAGELIQVSPTDYEFRYDESYRTNPQMPQLSLTMPKTQQAYHDNKLFPVFSNMLSEGANRRLQSRYLRLDDEDDFSILLETAQYDSIGAITVKPLAS